jgi:hypothetical protein
LVETVGKVAWEGIAGSWEMQEMGHSERVLEFLFHTSPFGNVSSSRQ